MPSRRSCTCDKCGRKFELVHHLHRHAILQHGLGYRVDPVTDCLQAYKPTDLAELQGRFRGWQGHRREGRSRSPRQSSSENFERRSHAPSRGRGGRVRRSGMPTGSRSPHRENTAHAAHRQDLRAATPVAQDTPPAREPAAETLDGRIERLLQSPRAPDSPSQLADISFGSAGSDLFESCVAPRRSLGILPPPASIARPSVDCATVSSDSGVEVSSPVGAGSLGAGGIGVILGRWPLGVPDAWRLLPRGPLPSVGSPDYCSFAESIRVARTTARVMAGLVLSLPGFDDADDRLPSCVIDWLCRFFSLTVALAVGTTSCGQGVMLRLDGQSSIIINSMSIL
jgi:hypothetical protein